MTRHNPWLTVVLGLAIASAGCYEAAFPLDATPQADLDARVVGAWRCLAADPDGTSEAITIVVKRAKDRIYDVTLEETDREPERYQAHASLVNGAPVVNLRDLEPNSEKPWTFLRYSFLRADVLAIQVANSKLLDGLQPTPAAVRRALEQLQGKPGLYEEVCVCIRQKE